MSKFPRLKNQVSFEKFSFKTLSLKRMENLDTFEWSGKVELKSFNHFAY